MGSGTVVPVDPTPARAVSAPTSLEQPGRTLRANPTNYLSLLRTLKPGDTLLLAPGIYGSPLAEPGLPIFNLHGTPLAPITITGPAVGPKPIFLGRRSHNTIRFNNASYVVVAHLEVDGRDLGGDGVNAQGIAHHITLEHLTIRGVGRLQGVVAISTNRAPTWNWIIRGNTITGAGTGLYLGNSDGANPFVAGLIEGNVIRDTIGYNLQVKHQAPWPSAVGLPTQPTKTVVRHNFFAKDAKSARGSMARPNVLIGDVPQTGPGSANGYEVYGNVFVGNPTETLFQAEGNVAFYSNLLVNHSGPGITIQRHNGLVRNVHVFGNTIVASGHGILVRGDSSTFVQQVVANAVFANPPILAASATANVAGSYEAADHHVGRPMGSASELDLYPLPGALKGPPIDPRAFDSFTDWNRDFDRRPRDWTRRGAYSLESETPAARSMLELKR